MGDPVTIAIASGVGSSVMGAKAAADAGRAQQKAHDYNAQINERNAKVAEQEGARNRFLAELDLMRAREDFRNLQGATQQAFRYNGFMGNTGTAYLVAMENANEFDRDAEMARYNARVGEEQAKESALQERMQADLNRMYGRAAAKAGRTRAMGTLLGGVSSAASLKAMT